MDQHRINQKNAEELAQQINSVSNNRFLDAGSLKISWEKAFQPVIEDWNCLQGYRACQNSEKTSKALNMATRKWIQGNVQEESTAVVLLVKNQGEAELYYGTEQISGIDYFGQYMPEVQWEKKAPADRSFTYNGFVAGSIKGLHTMDLLMDLELQQFYAGMIICPISEEELNTQIQQMRNQIDFLSQFKSLPFVYGSATRRVEEIHNLNIVKVIHNLQEKVDFLTKNRGDFFCQTIIKIGAQSEEDLWEIKKVIAASNHLQEQECVEPLRTVFTGDVGNAWSQKLAVPYVCLHLEGLHGLHVLSMQPISHVAHWCSPPLHTHEGFYVKQYQVTEDSLQAFSAPSVPGQGLQLGKTKDGKEAYLPPKLMTSHTCVFGASGGGKSTTVMKLLKETTKDNIPFLVIEAAKKEYHELVEFVPNLVVYTAGANGRLLYFNPLEPEEGILIETHVEMVVRALVAAHGNEHPIPEGLEGVLKLSYEKKGWYYGNLAYWDEDRPFPTMIEVYDNVEDYVSTHAQYGAEVRQNLQAALRLRTENLANGALGKVCSKAHGFSAAQLLKQPTVIELDDFGENATVFLMNIMMFKIQSFLSQVGKSGKLQRIIVLEEAHNVFREEKSENPGNDLNNQYFEKMLADVRASGTGVIICDQRPSIMSKAVIANSAIKIIHSLEEYADKIAVARALDFSEFQTKKLRELIPGECILTMRGQFGQNQIKVEALQKSGKENAFCSICSGRFNCCKEKVTRALNHCDKKAHYIAKITAHPYERAHVGKVADSLAEECGMSRMTEKCCLLAEALKSYQNLSVNLQRIIVNQYFQYLSEKQ